MTAHNQEGLRPDAISSESSEQRESKQRKPGFDLKYRLMALLAGVGANFLPTGEANAATTIDQQINDQRAGHTIKMNAADTEAFLAAPTVTPQATHTPAPVAMVDTAPKKSGGEKQPTATPISPEQTKVVQVVDVAGGINKRETPNGKVLGTTAGSSTQITTFERTTESEKTVGGHTWIQLTDGQEIFWVASDIAGVNERTEPVPISKGIGGGGNSEQDTLTQKQLLAEAQAQLGGTVADVREVNGVYVAFNANDNEVGKFANGAWVSSLPQTSGEVFQRQTVLPAGSETETAEFENATIETVAKMIPAPILGGDNPVKWSEGVTPEQGAKVINEFLVGMILKSNPEMTPAQLAEIIKKGETVTINSFGGMLGIPFGNERTPTILDEIRIKINPSKGFEYKRFATQNALNASISNIAYIAGSNDDVTRDYRVYDDNKKTTLIGGFYQNSTTGFYKYLYYSPETGRLTFANAKVQGLTNTADLYLALAVAGNIDSYKDRPLGNGSYTKHLDGTGLGKDYNPLATKIGDDIVVLPEYFKPENFYKLDYKEKVVLFSLISLDK